MPAPTFTGAPGLNLHYRLVGPARSDTASIDPAREACTLVFINSLGSDFRIWDAVAEAMPGHCRTLRYDKRGHGLSDAPPAPYTMRDHTHDLAGLLDALKLQKVVLVGVSVGGMIAQDFAAAFPERVAGLVLCDTGLKIGTPELWNERIAATETGALASVAETGVRRWFTPRFFDEQPAEAQGYLNMMARTPPAGYGGTCAALRDTDLHEQTAALKVPALVLCGDQDVATSPELNRELAAALGCDFRLIPGAGHIPSVEQPATVARYIGEFIDSLGAQAAGHDAAGHDNPGRDAASRYAAGMRIRRQVLGAAHVERASAGATELDRDFQAFITEYAWGGPWSRGILDTHTRHLITLAVLSALPREHELEMHIRATLNTGVTPDELREVFMHVAVYAGVPVANRALHLAKKALNERKEA
jgi:3-oxoadipate enol-lactonase/4-carboxymuconolactone decarboxylase